MQALQSTRSKSSERTLGQHAAFGPEFDVGVGADLRFI